jgi:hypothetical protein
MSRAAFQLDLRFDLIENRVVFEPLAFALSDRSAYLIQSLAAFLRDVLTIVTCEERLTARMVEQSVDGRKLAQ